MLLSERTPDGYAQVWCLYTPEPYSPDASTEQQINLWVRRCSVFSSQQAAIDYLNGILSQEVAWRPYDPLFPELWIGFDSRGSRWLCEAAPVDPLRPKPGDPLAVLRRLGETGDAVQGVPLEPWRSPSPDHPMLNARYWFCGGEAPMATGHAPDCPWLALVAPLLIEHAASIRGA